MTFVEQVSRYHREKKQAIKVVWVGLDNAGKTSIIQAVKHGIFKEKTNRTMGLNVDELHTTGLKFLSWDIGG